MGREFLSKSFWSWTVELLKAFRVLIPCSDTERRWKALENGRQAIWANTESRQPERPQLLRFLAAAVCSQVFFFFLLPLWGSPTRLSAAQPFHDWTKWGNTKVYYVARSSRPLLRRIESSKYFYGSKTRRGGRRIWERRNWGNGRKGVCGGMVEMKRFLHITQVCVISKNSIGLCDFPSHFFINQGKKI